MERSEGTKAAFLALFPPRPSAAPAEPRRMRRAVRFPRELATTTLFGTLTILLAQPIRASVPRAGLDPGWVTGINWARANELRFGPEVVFTYGPWGFLTAPSLAYPGHAILAAAFAGLAFLAFWIYARRALAAAFTPLTSSAVACLMTVLIAWASSASWVLLLAMVGYGMRLLRAGVRVPISWLVALSISSALLLEIKFSEGLLAIALTLLLMLRDRSLAGSAAVIATLTTVPLLLWLSAHQLLGDLPVWLGRSVQLTIGYPDAMYYEDGFYGWAYLSALLVLAVAFSGQLRTQTGPAARIFGWALVGAVGVGFFGVKQGFVRHDVFHQAALFTAAIPLMLEALAVSGLRLRVGLGVALALVSSLPTMAILAALGGYEPSAVSALRMVDSDQVRHERLDRAKSELRDQYAIGARLRERLGNSPVAIDPFEINAAWAYDMNWEPVPIIQPYSAYTPSLDEANARSLLSDSRRMVLRERAQVDDRMPAWDTPRYNMALFCNFSTVAHDSRWTLLKRRPSRCGQTIALASQRVVPGHQVVVPNHGPDQALTVTYTPDGRSVSQMFRTFLFKDPRPLEFKIDGATHRFPRPLAGTPLLLAAPHDMAVAVGLDTPISHIEVNTPGQIVFGIINLGQTAHADSQ